MQEIDLIIIGSGPAGISTALHLLNQDETWAERMLLIEKDCHPRPKICGGGVTRLGLALLEDLGIEFPLPIPQARVDDVRLKYKSRVVHVWGKPQFLVFHRADFDAYLAGQIRQRGARLLENEAVERISVQPGGVIIETSNGLYQAQAVVGADGAKGVTRRFFNENGSPGRVARLLEVLDPTTDKASLFTERYALFDFTPALAELQGYFWDFPARVNGEPHFNRGVYDARMARRRSRARLPKVLQDALAGREAGNSGNQLAGHPIHWFSPRGRFSAPRLLLVGDAAGADPLFGEGIAPALAYGSVAAQTLQRAFVEKDFTFRDYKRQLLFSPLGRYLLLRWFIAWWSYRLSGSAWFMHLMWTLGAGLAAIAPKPAPLYAADQQGGFEGLASRVRDDASK